MKKEIKSITLDILSAILSVAETAINVTVDRKEAYRIYSNNSNACLSQSSFCRQLHSLKQRGYIKIIGERNKDSSIIFTNKARIKLLEEIAHRTGWDKRYRFLSFDIPERLRNNRNKFRRAIKKIGFQKIQSSLWVCNKNAGDMVEAIAYEYAVEKYIVYIISDSSDIDGLIDKKFQ